MAHQALAAPSGVSTIGAPYTVSPLDLPPITISFMGLRHEVQVPSPRTDAQLSPEGANGGTAAGRAKGTAPARGLRWALQATIHGLLPATRPTSTLTVLDACCGELRPGRSVLFLSSPGGGSSTFLRLLAGRQAPSSGPSTLLYNGWSTTELAGQGVSMAKLASYCGEADEHEPLLSVRETLAFTYRTAVARPPQGRVTVAPARDLHGAPLAGGSPMPPSDAPIHPSSEPCASLYTPPDHEVVIDAMGLREAADTKIGSALRGISGGQKRRVTVAEALLTNARIVCLDQPTNGLDSATAVSVMAWACSWAKATSGILVAALQQAGPEVVALFDDALLLSDGHVLYLGPLEGLEPYLCSLGLVRPGYTDLADWAAEVLTDPSNAARQVLQETDRLRKDLQHAERLGDGISADAACGQLTRFRPWPTPEPAWVSGYSLGRHWAETGHAYVTQKRWLQPASAAQGISSAMATATVPLSGQPADASASWATDGQYGPGSVHAGTNIQAVDTVGRPRAGSQASTPLLASTQVAVLPGPGEIRVPGNVATGAAPSTPQLLQTSYARLQYGQHPVLGIWAQLWLVLLRQFTLSGRNMLFIVLRLVNCVVMGAILGTVYITIPPDNYILKFSLALFALCFIAFINNAEVPLAMLSRGVVYKQTSAGLYTEGQYNLALLAAHLPLTVVSDFLFATVLYWITGWVANVPRWLFFYAVVLSLDLAVSVLYRSFSYWTASQELAMTAATAFIAVGLATGGFFVTRFQLPIWLIWLLYSSPFFWGVVSLSNNEFLDPQYTSPLPGLPGQPRGEAYLKSFDFPYGTWWKLGGLLFLLGLYAVVGLFVQPWVLKTFRHDIVPGTQRAAATAVPSPVPAAPAIHAGQQTQSKGNAVQLAVAPTEAVAVPIGTSGPGHGRVAVPSTVHTAPGQATAEVVPTAEDIPAGGGTTATSVPSSRPAPVSLHFPSVTLAFRDVRYSVPAGGGKSKGKRNNKGSDTRPAATTDGTVTTGTLPISAPSPPKRVGVYGADPSVHSHASSKQLLRGVSGFARPGTLTALMGASGAGKTTLLDVIAFRKTTGSVSGQININSISADGQMMARVSGYCEQEDVHNDEYTVRESLMFSANLLLDPALSAAIKSSFVDDILHMLELQSLANRRVASLARGERKRLSVGVELAGNPPLLFLDEPTSGLDARNAALLVSVLRRVADAGRTVVCTIHQPSAAVFFGFSHLLLLAPGGHQVYFGPLGERAACVTAFLEGIPGVQALQAGINPADWMMRVLQGQTPTNGAKSGQDVAPATAVETGATGAGVGMDVIDAHHASTQPSTAGQGEGQHQQLVIMRQAKAREAAVAMGLPSQACTPSDFALYYRATRLHERMMHCLSGLLDQAEPEQAGTAAGPSAPPAVGAAPPSGPPPSRLPAPCDVELITLVTPVLQEKAREVMADFTRAADQPDPAARCDALTVPLQRGDVKAMRRPSWARRFAVVLRRQALSYARDPSVYLVRPAMMVGLAVFFGLCYLTLDYNTFAGTFSAFGAILASGGFVGVLLYVTVVPLAFRYRAVYYRERSAGLVTPAQFTLAVLLLEIPVVLLCVAIFSPIFFYLVGWPKSGVSHLLWYGLLTWLTGLCYTIGGWTAAFLFASPIIAQVVGGFFLAITFLMGCVFVPPAFMPRGWRWFIEVDFAAWATKGTAADQFYCAGRAAAGCPRITVLTPAGPAVVDVSSYLLGGLLKFPHSELWLAVPYMVANLAGFIIALALVVRFVSHQKR